MEITEGLISAVAYNLYKKCLTTERKDVVEAFKKAYERETNSISKVQLRVLLDCIEEAEKKGYVDVKIREARNSSSPSALTGGLRWTSERL